MEKKRRKMNKREIVILQTEEGTAKDINHLKRVWKRKDKKVFSPLYFKKRRRLRRKNENKI